MSKIVLSPPKVVQGTLVIEAEKSCSHEKEDSEEFKSAAKKGDMKWLSKINCSKYFDFSSVLTVPVIAGDDTNPPLHDSVWDSDEETKTFFSSLSSHQNHVHLPRVKNPPPLPRDLRNLGPPSYRNRPTISFDELIRQHSGETTPVQIASHSNETMEICKPRRNPHMIAPPVRASRTNFHKLPCAITGRPTRQTPPRTSTTALTQAEPDSKACFKSQAEMQSSNSSGTRDVDLTKCKREEILQLRRSKSMRVSQNSQISAAKASKTMARSASLRGLQSNKMRILQCKKEPTTKLTLQALSALCPTRIQNVDQAIATSSAVPNGHCTLNITGKDITEKAGHPSNRTSLCSSVRSRRAIIPPNFGKDILAQKTINENLPNPVPDTPKHKRGTSGVFVKKDIAKRKEVTKRLEREPYHSKKGDVNSVIRATNPIRQKQCGGPLDGKDRPVQGLDISVPQKVVPMNEDGGNLVDARMKPEPKASRRSICGQERIKDAPYPTRGFKQKELSPLALHLSAHNSLVLKWRRTHQIHHQRALDRSLLFQSFQKQ